MTVLYFFVRKSTSPACQIRTATTGSTSQTVNPAFPVYTTVYRLIFTTKTILSYSMVIPVPIPVGYRRCRSSTVVNDCQRSSTIVVFPETGSHKERETVPLQPFRPLVIRHLLHPTNHPRTFVSMTSTASATLATSFFLFL